MKIDVSDSVFVLLTIVFVALKLTGIIDWSWLWVLCPLWIPFAFVAAILGFVCCVMLIVLVLGCFVAIGDAIFARRP